MRPWGSGAKQFVFCLVTGALPVVAMESHAWEITPRVSTDLIYTDNVELTPDNEEHETILQLGAGVTASQRGGRLEADIDYAVQGLAYTEDDRRNEAFHQLDADSTLEVSREQLFIDAGASISQQLVDQRRGSSTSLITTDNNRLSVFTARVGPRLEQRIGSSLLLQATAQTAVVEELDSDSDATNADVEGTQNDGSITLSNIPQRNDSLQWTLQYSQTRTENERDDDTRQEQASLTLVKPVSRTLDLIGVAGEERNNFDRNANSEEPEGSFWEAGIRWRPSAQDLVEVRGGERFFGRTSLFSWQHQARRTTANINYNERITTTTQNLLNGGNGLTQITNQATINKELNARIEYQLPKSVIAFEAFETRSEFQVSLTEDRVTGVVAEWEWNIASRTQLSTDLTVREGEYDDRSTETDEVVFGVVLTRQMGPRTTASIGYDYSRFESDIAEDEYKANVLTLSFDRTF